jgi:hypothetical protein
VGKQNKEPTVKNLDNLPPTSIAAAPFCITIRLVTLVITAITIQLLFLA